MFSINRIIIIAAIGKNNELGISSENKMPWYLPGDFKYFKNQTLDHTLVMGRVTFESIGKCLPRRRHIVITTNKNWQFEGVKVYNSLEEMFEKEQLTHDIIYIAGGSTIYRQSKDRADELLLTEIDASFPKADVFFPDFNKDEYNRSINGEGEDNGISYKFVRYIKKDS